MALWVTKRKLRIARAATVWLIRRFIDPGATFAFVDDADVAQLQERDQAIGFHATGARYPQVNSRGQTAFEALVEEHCSDNATLVALARIVHDADRGSGATPEAPEAAGLRMITVSFPDVCRDDTEILAKSELLYDSLYHSLSKRTRSDAIERKDRWSLAERRHPAADLGDLPSTRHTGLWSVRPGGTAR
jgi:hypothetical protein